MNLPLAVVVNSIPRIVLARLDSGTVRPFDPNLAWDSGNIGIPVSESELAPEEREYAAREENRFGRWVTIRGRRVFIRGGASVVERKLRALRTYKPSRKPIQDRAYAEATRIAEGLGLGHTDDKTSVDATTGIFFTGKRVGIEIKTFQVNGNDKVTIHGPTRKDPVGSLQRKLNWARKNKAVLFVVVSDIRDQVPGYERYYSGHRLYYRRGVGSWRLANLTPVRSLEHLRELIYEEAKFEQWEEYKDMEDGHEGVWRTIHGRRIFIRKRTTPVAVIEKVRPFKGDVKGVLHGSKAYSILRKAERRFSASGILDNWVLGGSNSRFVTLDEDLVEVGDDTGVAEYYSPDQPRHPAGSSRGGEFAPHGSVGAPAFGLVGQLRREGGFSYSLANHKSPKLGLMLSIYPERSLVLTKANLNAAAIKSYVFRNRDLLVRKEHYLGGWYDRGTGKVFLDISVRVMDHDTARNLSMKHKQRAYWSLEEGKEYRVVEESKAHAAKDKPHATMIDANEMDDDDIESFIRALLEEDK